MSKSKPKISIVLTTKNEEENISVLCDSINSQTYTNWELIVVDNSSKDKTKEIAQKYTKNIYNKGPERSAQRNFGVSKASGDYVLILDADMKLEPSVLKECIAKVIKSKAEVLIIPEMSFGNNFWAKCRALERNCYIGDETIEAARFFDRTVYKKLGGYNKKMVSGEDWDLTRRAREAGYKISRVEAFIHHNEGNLSYIESIQKKYYYAQEAEAYISENVKGFRDIFLYLFRPAYFRHSQELLADPIHTLGFLFLKYSEFFVGGFFAILNQKSFQDKLRIMK